jgi:hypothetical protein
MALFRRKNQDIDAVPQEVRDYYQSERRERTGIAWLLALGTLVVTLLIASALFFGGKWVYNRTLGKPDAPKTAQNTNQSTQKTDESAQQEQNQATPNPEPQPSPSPSTNENTNNPSPAPSPTPTPTPAPTPSPSTNGEAGRGSSPSPQPAPAPSPTPTPAGPDSSLVNTGPADTAVIFGVVVVASTLLHRLVWVRHQSSRSKF